MKLSQLITINAITWMAGGIAFAVYGPIMLAIFGVPEIGGADVVLYWTVASFARLFGAALFGFGLLLFAVRGLVELTQGEIRTGIVSALLLAHLMGLAVATIQQFSVWHNLAGWVTIAIFSIFLLAYIFLISTIRKNAVS